MISISIQCENEDTNNGALCTVVHKFVCRCIKGQGQLKMCMTLLWRGVKQSYSMLAVLDQLYFCGIIEKLWPGVCHSKGFPFHDVCDVVALTFFRSLKTFRLTFLRMRNKCKIINVQRNDKRIFGINATGCSLTLL